MAKAEEGVRGKFGKGWEKQKDIQNIVVRAGPPNCIRPAGVGEWGFQGTPYISKVLATVLKISSRAR